MRFSAIAANMVCSPSGIHKVSAQEGDYENRRHSGDVYYRDRGHDVGIIEKIGAKRVTVRLIGPNGETAILVPIARLHPNGPNRWKVDL